MDLSTALSSQKRLLVDLPQSPQPNKQKTLSTFVDIKLSFCLDKKFSRQIGSHRQQLSLRPLKILDVIQHVNTLRLIDFNYYNYHTGH